MRRIMITIAAVVLIASCGQSYEETKRISREQRREAMRRDSAALKIAVMPTLDCLPLFVAQQEQLLDTVNGGVRLKMFQAQMDCDTAFERRRVEGMVTDVVRAARMEQRGMKVRYAARTNAYWQLLANKQSRIHQTKGLEDKIVAMTRFSITDSLSDWVAQEAKIAEGRMYKVQVNDVNVRMQMLQNNEVDALWLTEPWATVARLHKHNVLADSRQQGVQAGALVFGADEMRRPERAKQLALLVKAYNKACDMINEKGLHHYRQLIAARCKVPVNVVDSLPKDLKFEGGAR